MSVDAEFEEAREHLESLREKLKRQTSENRLIVEYIESVAPKLFAEARVYVEQQKERNLK